MFVRAYIAKPASYFGREKHSNESYCSSNIDTTPEDPVKALQCDKS